MPEHPIPHPDLGGYVLGTLEENEADAFRAHLAGCDRCRAEADELAGVPTLLSLAAPPADEAPANLGTRTREAVRRDMHARRVRRRLGQVVAAAAALVVVAGASLWLARDPGQQTVAVELMPTSASSDARAEAVLERDDTGIRVHLHVEGLSRPPDGAHYECWYVSDDDSPTRPDRVSAGTFRVPGPAPATIEMVTAADPATYTRIVVTLERDDGDPAPGEPVLASERWQPREA